MKQGIFLLTILLSFNCFGMPKHFEVWFLSKDSPKSTLLESPIRFLKQTAQALQCQPMGDYCFDPQVGLYKKGDENKMSDIVDHAEVQKYETYDFMEPAKSVEREMINCEEANFFDVFCGKAQKAKKLGKYKLEVWIDSSSTMRQVDFGGFDKKCSRERFLEDLSQTCPMNDKMKVYTFEEHRKELGSFDRVCISGGLNDMKKLMKDLTASKADNVVIITDIFEAEVSFIEVIESKGGIIKGIDKPLYPSQIHKQLQRVRKLCQ
jgi:hypothetical protein